MKKLNVIKQTNFFYNVRFFVKVIPSTRHLKCKVIDYATSNKSIMANKLPSINLEQFLRWNKTARIRTKPRMFRLPFNVYGAEEHEKFNFNK